MPAGDFRLLLSHSPDLIYRARSWGIDLMLAGHNHGGQVRVPVLGPILMPSRFGRRFDRGFFRVGRTWLHVSQGVAALHPYRFHSLPEVTRLVLRRTLKRGQKDTVATMPARPARRWYVFSAPVGRKSFLCSGGRLGRSGMGPLRSGRDGRRYKEKARKTASRDAKHVQEMSGATGSAWGTRVRGRLARVPQAEPVAPTTVSARRLYYPGKKVGRTILSDSPGLSDRIVRPTGESSLPG